MTDEMNRLHDAVTRVKALLDEPEDGLSSWHEMLRRACIDNQSALCSLGATPKACGIVLFDT